MRIEWRVSRIDGGWRMERRRVGAPARAAVEIQSSARADAAPADAPKALSAPDLPDHAQDHAPGHAASAQATPRAASGERPASVLLPVALSTFAPASRQAEALAASAAYRRTAEGLHPFPPGTMLSSAL